MKDFEGNVKDEEDMEEDDDQEGYSESDSDTIRMSSSASETEVWLIRFCFHVSHVIYFKWKSNMKIWFSKIPMFAIYLRKLRVHLGKCDEDGADSGASVLLIRTIRLFNEFITCNTQKRWYSNMEKREY